ncbi:MAG: hypothetical protein KR126chlam1_01214 [Chlamydiae bacterium]|nr:hypothetical protein [Chlamydiota bacterium]
MKEKVVRFVWNLLSVIIFPIGLYRIASSYIRDRIFSRLLSGAIEYPTSLIEYAKCTFQVLFNRQTQKNDNKEKDYKKWGEDVLEIWNGTPLTLTAADGAILNGAFFPGETHPEKAIIYLGGEKEKWEEQSLTIMDLQTPGTSFLVFNPRTDKRYERGYALDVFAAYQFLIKEKTIKPEDILLVGESMRAAIGVSVAALVQKEYPNEKISAVSIFSPSDLNLRIDQLHPKRAGICSRIARLASRMIRYDFYPEKGWETLKGAKWIFRKPTTQSDAEKASLQVDVDKASWIVTTSKKAHMKGFFWSDESTVLEKLIIPEILKLNPTPSVRTA